MPTADQLSNPPKATPGDGSTSVVNDDGTTTTSWPDGTTRVDYPDGSSGITFTDGSVLNLYADGTRTLNDQSGNPLDPATGAPLGALPTPPDTGPDRALRLLHGDERIADVSEAAELLKTFADALEGDISPAEWAMKVFEMTLVVVKAMEIEERGCRMRGWCYGILYGALDMGRPPEPTFRSQAGPDQEQLDQQWWDAGVSDAQKQLAAPGTGAALRNRVLLRVAYDGGAPQTTVTQLWQAACAHTGDDKLAQVYETLDWPAPTGV